MDAESRWSDRMESASAKRQGWDLDIQIEQKPDFEGCSCLIGKCQLSPSVMYIIDGIEIPLCADHASDKNACRAYSEDE